MGSSPCPLYSFMFSHFLVKPSVCELETGSWHWSLLEFILLLMVLINRVISFIDLYFRKCCPSGMWLLIFLQKSGNAWGLLSGVCTGTWCWRITATLCSWVSIASIENSFSPSMCRFVLWYIISLPIMSFPLRKYWGDWCNIFFFCVCNLCVGSVFPSLQWES